MRKLLPGVYHWRTKHPGIGVEVDSYYLAGREPVVLDPFVPKEGLGWFRREGPPAAVILTNRLHRRDNEAFSAAFGAPVFVNRAGLKDHRGRREVRGFGFGEVLPGGLVALRAGPLCPDETALYRPAGKGLIAAADALVRWDGKLGFVPDDLLGNDPEKVKEGTKAAFRKLLSLRFDALLLAHGPPVARGAKRELARFLG